MKTTRILCTMAFAALTSAAMAQSYDMNVNMKDGSKASFPADRVTNVTFSETSTLPGAAGSISLSVQDNGYAMLDISPIANATSYRWMRNDTTVQESPALSYYATKPGLYSVEGVNDEGTGAPSGKIKVTPITKVFNILTEEYMPDSLMRNYVKTEFNDGKDTLTNLHAAQFYGEFDVPNRATDVKGIEYFISIDTIDAHYCMKFTSLDASKNVCLKKLNLNTATNLTDLNIKGLTQLKSLDVAWTKVRNINLSELPKDIKVLKVNSYTGDIKSLPDLVSFVSVSKGGTIDVSSMPHLEELDLSMNSNVSAVNVSNCNALKTLTLSYCSNVSSIDVSTCPSLEYLYTNYSGVGNVDLSLQRANMRVFNPQHSNLTVLDVKNMPKLEMCQAGECKLTKNPDFTGCISLKNLRLESTGITAIDLKDCKNLEDLNIYNDSIESLALEDMPRLWNINVFNNPRQKTLTLKNLPSVVYLSCYSLGKVEKVDISTLNHHGAWYSLSDCPNLKEIKVWPEFDIKNPPSWVDKDEATKFVYEFSK